MKTKCRSTQARLKGQAHGLDHETEREAFERNQEEKTANRRGGRMVYRFVEENTAMGPWKRRPREKSNREARRDDEPIMESAVDH